MSVISGFFNSVNDDRLYNAIDMGRLFDGLIHDGVFATIGDHMIVSSRGGYRVGVGTGKAWFDHTWTTVDSLFVLTVEPADSILKRIDAVVLETNHTFKVRKNTIKIVKGDPSSNPSRPNLIHDDEVNQYPLAFISVQNGISQITQSDITNAIGTSDCPFVTAVNQSVTIDELMQQWKYQFNDFMNDSSKEFRDWQSAEKQSFDDWERRIQLAFEDWQSSKKQDFDTWWDDVIDILNSITVGEFTVRFVQAENDIKELNRHLDTFEEYVQKYCDTFNYEIHITEPVNGSYGDFNQNEWLIPGIYVFHDGEALIKTLHAPTNANFGAVMKVYDPSGSNIKDLIDDIYLTGLPDSIRPFCIIQEIEYARAGLPRIRRAITQNTTNRTFSPWMFTEEMICRKNVSVPANSWSTSGISKFAYKASISMPGINSNWYADVYFDRNTVLDGKMAGFTETADGSVIIYSKSNTAITIPAVICKSLAYMNSEITSV